MRRLLPLVSFLVACGTHHAAPPADQPATITPGPAPVPAPLAPPRVAEAAPPPVQTDTTPPFDRLRPLLCAGTPVALVARASAVRDVAGRELRIALRALEPRDPTCASLHGEAKEDDDGARTGWQARWRLTSDDLVVDLTPGLSDRDTTLTLDHERHGSLRLAGRGTTITMPVVLTDVSEAPDAQ